MSYIKQIGKLRRRRIRASCRSPIKRRRRQDHHSDQSGTALAAIGERVLIVDLDPQGNASTGLGIDRRAATARPMTF